MLCLCKDRVSPRRCSAASPSFFLAAFFLAAKGKKSTARPLRIEGVVFRHAYARAAHAALGARVTCAPARATLHACRAGVPRVQRGLRCNGPRNVATRSAQRTCTPEAWRSEVF